MASKAILSDRILEDTGQSTGQCKMLAAADMLTAVPVEDRLKYEFLVSDPLFTIDTNMISTKRGP